MQKENKITLFYWQENGKENSSKKLNFCSSFDKIEKVKITPLTEEEISQITENECPLFSVETSYDRKSVFLSYYFKLAWDSVKTPYITELNETEPLFFRTMVFYPAEGSYGILEAEDTLEVTERFNIIPEEVQKYCFNEIKEMEELFGNKTSALKKEEFEEIFSDRKLDI